jgi:hypothetical protein
MSGISTGFVLILLEVIDLLDHRDRNDQIIVLKVEQRLRIVKQNIGVEDVCFFQCPNFPEK